MAHTRRWTRILEKHLVPTGPKQIQEPIVACMQKCSSIEAKPVLENDFTKSQL